MAAPKGKRAVVLMSGGLDSTVCLWWALSRGWRCEGLAFDYGQRHRTELHYARRLARQAGVRLRTVRFSLPWSESSLTDPRSDLPKGRSTASMSARIPSTYVPGRNTLFLGFGLSLADEIGADAIIIGANSIDYSGYPDCRPGFLSAFEKVARAGSRSGTEGKRRLRILAPLLRLTKADIVRLGRTLDAPIKRTWSCYAGRKAACGRCDSCRLRAKGFAEAAGRP